MMTKLEGSPVQVFKLAAQAAPNGGLIAMEGTAVRATAIRADGSDTWTVTAGEEQIAGIEGNTSVVTAFLHGYFWNTGRAEG
jgi:hypothetical protein